MKKFFKALRNAIEYFERPPQTIKDLMKGPIPPEDFKGDGCSFSPDLWFREACRYHDWHYHLLRDLDAYSGEWEKGRKEADKNLKHNIKTLSNYCIKNGKLVHEPKKWYYRKLSYSISKIYYKAVRRFGWFAADGKITSDKES